MEAIMDFSHDRSGTWSPQTTMFLGVFPEGRELASGSHDCLLAKQNLMFLQYFASSTVIHFTGLGAPSKTSKPIGSCKKETTTKQYGVKATTKQPLNKLFSGQPAGFFFQKDVVFQIRTRFFFYIFCFHAPTTN